MADGKRINIMQPARSSKPALFFSKEEQTLIVEAIRQAEKNTSGEIRVHLEEKVKGDILDRAKKAFEEIGMAKTEARNGVLIFIGIKTRRFAIIGDSGINEKVPSSFWDDIARILADHFRANEFTEGLSKAIEMIGEKLKKYFPYQKGDINELPNQISVK